jgi:type I restriction enzyme S subunit
VKDKLGVDHLYFHYLLLKRQNFERIGSDSAVPGLNRNSAYAIRHALPPVSLVKDFEKNVDSLFRKIRNNHLQLRTLAKLREAILPKLMRGEVRVKEFSQ